MWSSSGHDVAAHESVSEAPLFSRSSVITSIGRERRKFVSPATMIALDDDEVAAISCSTCRARTA